MFTNDSFRKVTGVALDSTTEALEKGLAAAVKKTAASEIATALIVRTLVVEHGWKVGESAARVGLSSTAAGVAGSRGKVLWETGPESAIIVWQTVKTLPSKVLADLATTLQGMTTEADRTEYVIRLGARTVVTARLGDAGTPDRIDALTDALIADGHRTPVAAKSAVAGLSERLSIPLPKVERKGTADKVTQGKADLPTFDQAMKAALAAVEQAQMGADEVHPVALTVEQADLVAELIAALITLSDTAKVHAPA